MDRVSRRQILTLSLAAIVVSWGYTLWASFASPVVIPARFSALVLDIVIRKAIVLGVVLWLLHAGAESLRTLGFASPRWLTATARGVAYGVALFIVVNVGLTSVLGSVLHAGQSGVAGSLTTFFRDPSHLLVWIPIGVIGGGLVEEIERAFVLTRFEQWLGERGLYLGLALSSLIFGVAHLYQSASSAMSAGVSGLVFGLIYLRRRSGLEAAACHAFADVLGVIAATLLAR